MATASELLVQAERPRLDVVRMGDPECQKEDAEQSKGVSETGPRAASRRGGAGHHAADTVCGRTAVHDRGSQPGFLPIRG